MVSVNILYFVSLIACYILYQVTKWGQIQINSEDFVALDNSFFHVYSWSHRFDCVL